MRQLWLWLVRSDGQIEQHIGPFIRSKRVPDPTKPGMVMNVPDEEWLNEVHEILRHYVGGTAYDMMKDVTERLPTDETGAMKYLAAHLAEVGHRIELRQARDRAGNLRAEWLADIGLANMKVDYRAED